MAIIKIVSNSHYRTQIVDVLQPLFLLDFQILAKMCIGTYISKKELGLNDAVVPNCNNR